MSPLWGLRYLLCRVFYKHAAPLGLNTDVPSSVPSAESAVQTDATYRPSGAKCRIEHYIKKPLINQPHRDNITGIRKGVLTFCLSPIRQVL